MGFSATGKGNSQVISKKFQKRITKTGLICLGCKKDKPHSEYPGDNKHRIYSRCRICLRDEVRAKKKKFEKFTFDWK